MKKILVSMLAIFLAIGLVGTGAMAHFQDTETSTGNTFTAGTLDLELLDLDEGLGPPGSVTATWTMYDMEPGVTTVLPLSVSLMNRGTIAADHVEISFSHVITETPHVESDTNWSSYAADMARWIEITAIKYVGVDLMPGTPAPALVDANGNGFLDLDDLTRSPNTDEGGPLDNLFAPPPGHGGTTFFIMTLKFNAGATNDIQGDTLTTTVTFTLNQDSSQ